MRVRMGVSTEAAAPDIETYAEGVRLMKERSAVDAMDPLGWEYQSRIHGKPDGSERAPGDPPDWSWCQHGSWFFLPWHRMFLLQLERIVASLTAEPEFALPYWDYPNAAEAVIPAAFLDRDSPLFNATRSFRPPTELGPERWRETGTFIGMGGGARRTPVHRGESPGQLEANPHNPVHGLVGGDMARYQSPLDPLFWIHHCNVDRLWDAWLRLPGRANPTETDWLDTEFEFPDPDTPDGRRTWRVAQVATTELSGYAYDTTAVAADERRILAAMADDSRPPRRDDRLELLGASGQGASVTSTVRVSPDREAWSTFRETFDAAAARDAGPVDAPLYLRLENVGMDEGDASSMWNVYVRVGGGPRHLVGTIAPFGLAGLTASGGRQTLTFDVSDLAGELLAVDDADLEIFFEAIYEDAIGQPYWERAAIYTTAG